MWQIGRAAQCATTAVVAGVVRSAEPARESGEVAAAIQIVVLSQAPVVIGAVKRVVAPTRMRGGNDADAGTIAGGGAVARGVVAGTDTGLQKRKGGKNQEEREKLFHNVH